MCCVNYLFSINGFFNTYLYLKLLKFNYGLHSNLYSLGSIIVVTITEKNNNFLMGDFIWLLDPFYCPILN